RTPYGAGRGPSRWRRQVPRARTAGSSVVQLLHRGIVVGDRAGFEWAPDARRAEPVDRSAAHRVHPAAIDLRLLGRQDPGPATVVVDQLPQRRSPWPSAGADGARVVLAVLDLHVRVEVHADQVVGTIPLDDRLMAPTEVEGHADLVHRRVP